MQLGSPRILRRLTDSELGDLRRAAFKILSAPWLMLGGLIVLQWGAIALLAQHVRHNGWLYYSGGDETWYSTTSWLLSTGHIPYAGIGYGYAMLTAPLAGIAGPYLLSVLPSVVLLNVLVLQPVGTLCVYGIAHRLGGRRLGCWAALVWVLAPFATIPLVSASFRGDYTELFLPQALGLTYLGDFPSMICLLAAAYFVFRALDSRSLPDALAAGALAGFAIGIKPANALFVAAPIAAFAAAGPRAWRLLPAFAAALAPALVTLAVWKKRGLGTIPLQSEGERRLAAGGSVSDASEGLRRYIHLDWHHLHVNLLQFGHVFWSVRIVEWLVLAGIVAALRRGRPQALMLTTWLAAYVLLKGSASVATVFSTSFFRLCTPAFPAAAILIASIPLLVPRLGSGLVETGRATRGSPAEARKAAVALILAFAVVPLLIVLVARPLRDPRAATEPIGNVYVPIAPNFPTGVVFLGTPTLLTSITWAPPELTSTKVTYRVYRSPAPSVQCQPLPHATYPCGFAPELIWSTPLRKFEYQSPPGALFYRVGVVASWRASRNNRGDLIALSPETRVFVP